MLRDCPAATEEKMKRSVERLIVIIEVAVTIEVRGIDSSVAGRGDSVRSGGPFTLST